MSTRQKLLWAVVGLAVLLLVAAISTPNLMRSRIAASKSQQLAMLRSATEEQGGGGYVNGGVIGGIPQTATEQKLAADKKLIQNAELALTVIDVREAADKIREITEADKGEIDKLEISDSESGYVSATLSVRVPASGLESALEQFKRVALRTEREQISTRDVTREFYDNEAHLRNLRAEEQQYLDIMKQARTVKDTVDVAEKLSDVRDRIERRQTQIQLMMHDIEMSVVTITLTQEADARVFGVRWRPLYNAKIAIREMLEGLGEWLDWVVAVLIKLPLILIWVLTVGAILFVAWIIGKTAWLRFLRPNVVNKSTQE